MNCPPKERRRVKRRRKKEVGVDDRTRNEQVVDGYQSTSLVRRRNFRNIHRDNIRSHSCQAIKQIDGDQVEKEKEKEEEMEKEKEKEIRE